MSRFVNLFAICLLFGVSQLYGRILDECQMAREFYAAGIDKEVSLPNYVCIAEHESHGDTNTTRGPGWDGSYDWGLFLVSDNYWCSRTGPGKACNIKCDDLLSENVTNAVHCAEKVVAQNGFWAWQSWSQFCRNDLPDLTPCFK